MAGDLEAVQVGKADGVAIASVSYYGDGHKEGSDLSDRLWFQELKRTLRSVYPMCSSAR